MLSGTGRNVVAEQINRQVDEDVAEQREEIENGRANANNALQALRDRYNFDIPQAESALKIAQLGVVNAQLKEYEGMKMSQDSQMGLEQWMAENQKAQFLEARKLYTASMGKQTRKEQLAFQQGSAGGYRDPNHKEKMDKYAEIEAGQKTRTIPTPGEGGEKIPDALIVYDTNGNAVKARTEEEAKGIRKQYAIFKKTMPSVDALEKAAGFWDQMSPDERASWGLNFESAASTFNTGLGQNSMKDDDFKRWHGYLSQGGLGAKKALAEMRKIATNSYQADVDSQTGPQVRENFSRGKPKASYANKRATTPTVGHSQQGTSASLDDLHQYLNDNYGGGQ